mmetsp:Transcript_30464/g.29930  ORF Transcript_30464/g.29930 Transcript_30464/m.29930 type:complete len:81 (+) Transcript_30464:262-504(+)
MNPLLVHEIEKVDAKVKTFLWHLIWNEENQEYALCNFDLQKYFWMKWYGTKEVRQLKKMQEERMLEREVNNFINLNLKEK